MRKGLARQHLVAHSGVVDESGFDRRGLREILGLQGLVSVHVGVMRACAVVEWILDELKAGNADSVESFVIGSAGVAIGDGGNAEVLQRFHPLREDRSDCGVLLEIDAANSAAAVVHVKVRRNFLMLALYLDGPARVAI